MLCVYNAALLFRQSERILSLMRDNYHQHDSHLKEVRRVWRRKSLPKSSFSSAKLSPFSSRLFSVWAVFLSVVNESRWLSGCFCRDPSIYLYVWGRYECLQHNHRAISNFRVTHFRINSIIIISLAWLCFNSAESWKQVAGAENEW